MRITVHAEEARRMTEVWAWTVIDPLTDTEGIIAVTLPGGRSVPMVGATRSLIEKFYPFVQQVAREMETEPILRHFVQAEEA